MKRLVSERLSKVHTTVSESMINKAMELVKGGASLAASTRVAFFMDCVLDCTGCLVPRSDSETFFNFPFHDFYKADQKIRIVDLGVGCGPLLITALQKFPNAFGLGIDNNEHATRITLENAKRNNVIGRTQVLHVDWNEVDEGKFEIVFWNPPYVETAIAKNMTEFDPISALDGGLDGLDFYKNPPIHFCKVSVFLLLCAYFSFSKEGGLFLVEIGKGMSKQVQSLIKKPVLSVMKDLQNLERIIVFKC